MVLAAGAVATALLAMLTLLREINPPDVADVASLTRIEVSRQATLADFARSVPGIEVTLSSLPESPAATGVTVTRVAAESIPTRRPPPAGSTALAGAHHELFLSSMEASTLSPPVTTAFSDTPSPPQSPSASVSPYEPPSSLATGSPSEPTPPGETNPPRGLVSRALIQDVIQDASLARWHLPPRNGLLLVPRTELTVVDPSTPGQDGLEPHDVAETLADALKSVEAVPSIKDAGKLEPLGQILSVTIRTKGLSRVPLFLTWSLDGVDVPLTWRAETVAYRLTATTDDDGGNVEVWVPALKGTHRYNATVVLAYESDGTVADRRSVALPVS